MREAADLGLELRPALARGMVRRHGAAGARKLLRLLMHRTRELRAERLEREGRAGRFISRPGDPPPPEDGAEVDHRRA